MCVKFIENYVNYKTLSKQKGSSTYYKKRDANDSKLDINKSIKEQFNLLRIVNNREYPAFFEIDGHKFLLKIEKFENSE